MTNKPPYLDGKIEDQTIPINMKTSIHIPDVIDREGQQVIVSAHEYGKSSLPPFIIFESTKFHFEPT